MCPGGAGPCPCTSCPLMNAADSPPCAPRPSAFRVGGGQWVVKRPFLTILWKGAASRFCRLSPSILQELALSLNYRNLHLDRMKKNWQIFPCDPDDAMLEPVPPKAGVRVPACRNADTGRALPASGGTSGGRGGERPHDPRCWDPGRRRPCCRPRRLGRPHGM